MPTFAKTVKFTPKARLRQEKMSSRKPSNCNTVQRTGINKFSKPGVLTKLILEIKQIIWFQN